MATTTKAARKSMGEVSNSPGTSEDPRGQIFPALKSLIACTALVGGIVWLYWENLLRIETQWSSNPHYSHGYLVPIFALGLLISRRSQLKINEWSPSWWGCSLLFVGLGLKVYSSYYYIEALSHVSLILTVCAVPAILWGAGGFRWALPALAFLVFMIPLPHRFEGAMQGPLRSVGTTISTYFLQTIGIAAYSEGNVIVVGQQTIGVAEACSGLNMLMVFFALSTAVALILSESWIVRLVLVASAIPIALAANVLRIASTAAVLIYCSDTTIFGIPGNEFANRFFHDWAGWFMMPVGLAMLWCEIWILDRLIIEVPDQPLGSALNPSIAGMQHGRKAARSESQQ